jgi:hypothetical protein
MMRFYFSITWCDPNAGKVRVMNTSHVSTADETTGNRGSQGGQGGLQGEEGAPETGRSRRPVRSSGKWRAGKVAFAFVFGAVAFAVLFQLCDVVRPVVALGLGAVSLFVCQYLLSRGNAQAARTDWGIVLAMNGLPLALLAGSLVVNLGAHLGQGPDILKGLAGVVLGIGCAYAGAVVAARTARR